MLQEITDSENNILYELLIYVEWQQEPEFQQARGTAERNDGSYNEWFFKRWLPSQPCPPLQVQQLIHLQMPWAFAIGGSGAVIAILQDTSLEIRTSRDEYGAIIGRTQVSKDLYPQWRKILWSPDCNMLVCAHSNGKLDFFDLIGAHMFTIDNMASNSSQAGKPDFSHAIAGMAFSDARIKNTQWSYEFIASNYLGNIYGFYISPSDGFKQSHKFSLASRYPFGITSFVLHPADNILIVYGKLPLASCSKDVAQLEMSAWRILSDTPYYKLALTTDAQMRPKESYWKTICSRYNFYQSSTEDLVFKMSICPNGKILAAIHTSGALSFWDLPSLRLRNKIKKELQPNFDDPNSQYCEPGIKKRVDILLDTFQSHIIDINWWSDEAIIIVRHSGAVTVSSIKSLQNLLGVSPEWFEPSPAVTSFCDRGFLVIEREVRVKGRRSVDDLDDEDEMSDDEEPSIFAYTYEMAQRALFFITDSDRFHPPRKKMKMITKTYRLLCLKSTTPEELYSRKINNEEYGEALALAKTYDLDSDLVYQRQWRKMPATVESIHDYLSKIKKRSWVLHECMERVPESFEAAKELLHYGLRGTDLESWIAIGRGEDHGRFILSSAYDVDEEDDYEAALSFNAGSGFNDSYEIKKAQQQKKRAELLKQINFKKLTLEQKQLSQCRLKLLHYLDKLMTYETILGGPILADQNYDHNFFKQFRSQCGLEAALFFACNSNWEAVATLFSYHGPETLPYRLTILNNFPETTSPIEYQSLLPLFNERELVFYPWDEHQHREADWCETRYKKNTLSDDFVQEFYEKYNEMAKYRQLQLSPNVVSDWFSERAKEVESRSGLVDNALQLLKLGMQRNIEGLEKLYDDMSTLEILVYECGVKVDLSLKEFEALSDFEKIKLMMSMTSKENFIKNLQQWVLPYLNRCAKYDSGSEKSLLKSYILSISKNDLFYCKKILESVKYDPSLIILDFNEVVALSLDCIYYCERTDELKNANSIWELLSSLPDSYSRTLRRLYSLPGAVANLKKHICVAVLLDKNGLAVPLSMVQNVSENSEEVKKVFTKLTRMASHKVPVLDEEEWTDLLTDILEMQKILFSCVSYEDCYEIVYRSLLCSGRAENISFAGKGMECNNKLRKERSSVGPQSFKLPFSKSVALVLAASQEYFNSSSNGSDPCMALAKSCLNLIEDVPASIEQEYDLIASISLLQEFNVNILPLQVRLCENRMELVQEALQKRERNYKKSQKIMKLAHLLRAGNLNSHEREGKVLTLIGDYAFQAKDYNECLVACLRLMDGGYKEGWLICYTLGGCSEFNNIPARSSLMSFALAYCSEDLIETILKSKSELQLQVLQDRVKFLMGDFPMQFSAGDSEDAASEASELDANGLNTLWQTSERTLQALHTTTQTAKVVLTSVKSVQFWKDAINWIQPPGQGWNGKTLDEEESNRSLTKQGTPALYDGLIENAHISKLEANYQRYARPDLHQSLEISCSILRASLLQDSLKVESAVSVLADSVLIDVSKDYLPEDFVYSLFVLLALNEVEKAETLFGMLPSSPIVFQFACLYYAFQIQIAMGQHSSNCTVDPTEFYKGVLNMDSEIPEKCKKYFNLLRKYDKKLYDFIQAEILQSIGGGVDAVRFANDDVYKRDTIIGISMTLDEGVFHTAVTLAHHYNVPVWDLYMAHLEYLFSESSITASILTERIEKYELTEKLMPQRRKFESRLRESVYSSINGKDHDKLLTCFSLLERCGDHDDELKVKPSLHKKLVAKFKGAMKSINYKLLMSPESSSTYLTEILTESNVHVFAKAASNIPKLGGLFYEPSNIYCLWTQKFFFDGSTGSVKIPTTKTEWIHRYQSCTDMLQRLDSSDILELVDRIIFSEKALEKMSIDCRSEIVKRIIKFCRGKSSTHKNNILLCTQWGETVTALNSLYMHLQRLEEEILVQLRESEDPKVKEYCKNFDLSKSSIQSLQCLLAKIVLEGPNLELLKTFISCCPSEINWEPADAYIKAIDTVLIQMKQSQNDGSEDFQGISPIQALEAILQDITKQEEELMMIEDMAAERLNEFCQDPEVSVTVRLGILQLLEKTNCISAEYNDLLLLYRTQAVVSSLWPELHISEEEIKDDFQRKILFDSLLSLCGTVDQFSSVSKLLSHWPAFSENSSKSSDDEPWTRLLCGLISTATNETLTSAIHVFENALDCPTFNFECCQEVFRRIKEKGSILHTLKCALKTSYPTLHLEALECLKNIPEITTAHYDDELLNLVLKHGLTVQILGTGLYKPVIELLLHCQDDNEQESYRTLDNVVRELSEAGFEFEAGSLLLIKSSTHTGLSTFSSAITVLHRWLSVTKS